MTTEIRKPIAVSILSVLLFLFSPFIFFGSLFLWGEGFILQFPPGVDLSFPVADIVINTPATIIAAIGLWRMRKYGYVAAQLGGNLSVWFCHHLCGGRARRPSLLNGNHGPSASCCPYSFAFGFLPVAYERTLSLVYDGQEH